MIKGCRAGEEEKGNGGVKRHAGDRRHLGAKGGTIVERTLGKGTMGFWAESDRIKRGGTGTCGYRVCAPAEEVSWMLNGEREG
jgi:hypothetical protein